MEATVTPQAALPSLEAWKRPRLAMLAGLVVFGLLVCLDIWRDIFTFALKDEEAQQVFLALPVFAWVLWTRRTQVLAQKPQTSIVGPALIALGWVGGIVGFMYAIQAAWHLSAVLVLVGCVVTVVGLGVIRAAWPAAVVLIFLVPVPARIRLEMAVPLQRVAASATQFVGDLFGMEIHRAGNWLSYNNVPITIAEGCNGMRMMFMLILVSFAFAFISPLKPWARAAVVLLSPLTALLCNLIRLVPTVYVYGHYEAETAEAFHDYTGWVMVVVAFFLLIGTVHLLNWAGLPVFNTGDSPRRRPVKPPIGRRREPLALLTLGNRVAPVLSALLLVGMAVALISRPGPEQASGYHRNIAQTAGHSIPDTLDDWQGTDDEIPAAAQKLLKPNVIRTRIFRNQRTGERFTLVFVQCKDARDMAGHYPPICYEAHGWNPPVATPRTWEIGGRAITGTEYAMTMDRPTGQIRQIVYNFMALPDGTTRGDMNSVYRAAADYTQRHFGAAQFQFVVSADMTQRRRDEIFTSLITEMMPLLEAMDKHRQPTNEG